MNQQPDKCEKETVHGFINYDYDVIEVIRKFRHPDTNFWKNSKIAKIKIAVFKSAISTEESGIAGKSM